MEKRCSLSLRFEKLYNVGLFFVYRCFRRFESVLRGIKMNESALVFAHISKMCEKWCENYRKNIN